MSRSAVLLVNPDKPEAAKAAAQDFDPLEFDRFTRFQEITRMMAESVNDVTTVQHALLRNLDHADAAIVSQARQNRELSQALEADQRGPSPHALEACRRCPCAPCNRRAPRALIRARPRRISWPRFGRSSPRR